MLLLGKSNYQFSVIHLPLNKLDLSKLPSTFYRVTVNGIIFDEHNRLLVCVNCDGDYEIPGGGLEHGESIEQGLQRELDEELHAELISMGPIVFVYGARSAYKNVPILRIGIRASIRPGDLTPDDTIVRYCYVTREEFVTLGFTLAEKDIADYADVIWG